MVGKDKEDKNLSSGEGEGENNETSTKKTLNKNPDEEDPRLISPLQEPDRPAPSERIPEERKDPEYPSR